MTRRRKPVAKTTDFTAKARAHFERKFGTNFVDIDVGRGDIKITLKRLPEANHGLPTSYQMHPLIYEFTDETPVKKHKRGALDPKDKPVAKQPAPNTPASSMDYAATYTLKESERGTKSFVARTKRTAKRFKSQHLDALGQAVYLNVYAEVGVFVVSSRIKKFLQPLPKEFEGFERGKVERPAVSLPAGV